MADAILSVVTERVSNLIIGEAFFLSGVKEEVTRLLAELKRMQSFLKDADQKLSFLNQDERVHNWVAEIRGIAYDTEDILDYFYLNLERRQVPAFSCKRIISVFMKVFYLHQLGNQIKCIRTKLGDVEKSLLIYGIKFVDEGEEYRSKSEMRKQLRRSHPYKEDEGLISLEGSTRDLMAQLMREEGRVRVVSIVGMGGIGKTTLAKKIYNKAEVKRHFDCYSWAFISQQFSVNSILLGILKDVAPQEIGGENMKKEKRKGEKIENEKERINEEDDDTKMKLKEDEDLASKLCKVLNKRRYLVVLDDIWQIEAWESLKHAFPNGVRGSKILLTTRIKEIALSADPYMSSPIELPFLSEEDSWTLFINKTFPRDIFDENYCISPELEKLGREMVRKCGGLPLAIVVLGGLLATKKSQVEWELVNRNMTAQLIKLDQKKQYGGVYGILALSYHALPWHLKPCFLYFSVFPEDSEIDRKSLIRMWIAEGFVSQSSATFDSESLEYVGDEYMEDLIGRSMVQVSSKELHFDVSRQRWRTGRKVCRMHDLMRDMCVSMAREENFLEVVSDHETRGATVKGAPIVSSASRRICIHGVNKIPSQYLSMIEGNVHLRALFYFDQLLRDSNFISGVGLGLIAKNFQLLRVLHIGVIVGVISSIPREIDHLVHLRYLRWSMDGSLPASICSLKFLQTLDLRRNRLQRSSSAPLPDVLWKLECLKYFLVDRHDAVNCRVDTLRNLETLRWIRAEFLLKHDAILKLTNLRDLRIVFEKPDGEVEAVLRSPILDMGHLHSLYIAKEDVYDPFPNLEPISRCQRLSKIYLKGKISEYPHPFSHSQLECLPSSLTKIVLTNSRLMKDPMPILEKLPNLMSLHLLDNSFYGSKMVCSARGFPMLMFLELNYIWKLEEWRIEKEALPNLKTLTMDHLFGLEMVPRGLKFVTTLQLLDIRRMPRRYQRRIRMNAEDFEYVKHISQIMFDDDKL